METSKSINTRRKIVNCARQVFRKYGYKNATMQLIADEAETSLSLVKKYFPRKQNLVSVIARNQAFKVKEYVDMVLEQTGSKDDALLEYLLIIKIIFRDIYTDPAVRRYHYESMDSDLGERSMYAKPFDFIAELYLGVVKQFNINMSAEEFEARKIQIYGAQTAIGEAYAQQVVHFDDEARLEYSVSAACILLGVSNFVYSTYKTKAEALLESIDYKEFGLL